ncbi:hypothetical protein V500_01153 [Pseudogymnoascus sp. VKM F-4518 (FW-2643)]|nr:hypothetical protein V500_01153 [Pseudogymnoascus sp. VKM F-4518 (FW-2643)]
MDHSSRWSLCHEKWSASVITRKGNPRPPHLNGSQLSFARPSTLAMADEASNQRRKRCLADESADQSPTSWCQEVHTRNRPERDQRMSPKKVAEIVETLVEALNKRKRQSSRSPEWYKAMAKELNAKPSDPVATDKSDIEQELRSGSSILVLESTPSRRSHCRALLCLRHKLTGIINIESDYRFNLKDLTGRRAGDLSHHLQPNRFYHVTCLEHTLGPQSLLEFKHIVMEGGTTICNTQGPLVSRTTRFHPMVEDWFTYSGCIFDIKEYSNWSKAYAAWEREDSKREWKHWEANYFSPERTPRLLSEVLAAITGVHQIDLLPESFLSTVREQTLGNASSELVSHVEIDAETTTTA